MGILKFSAQKPQIEHIFVHHGIKKHLRDITVSNSQSWLRRMQFYLRDNLHFYLHLKYKSGCFACLSYPPGIGIKGSGRDSSLDWWFTDASHPPRNNERLHK
ncbi:MAG: Penicillin-insensitive murein endopeptidase [Candidatus Tokpelaia sp. JSC188]|nr:MAG: Penicillin-insensitive murein endopeptidase [Candidatus Tokpelaia sp. JSC188]